MTGQLPLYNPHDASAIWLIFFGHPAIDIFRDQLRICAAHNHPVSGVPCVGSR